MSQNRQKGIEKFPGTTKKVRSIQKSEKSDTHVKCQDKLRKKKGNLSVMGKETIRHSEWITSEEPYLIV